MPDDNKRWAVPYTVNVSNAIPDADKFLDDPIKLSQVCDPESWYVVPLPDNTDQATTVTVWDPPSAIASPSHSSMLTSTISSSSSSMHFHSTITNTVNSLGRPLSSSIPIQTDSISSVSFPVVSSIAAVDQLDTSTSFTSSSSIATPIISWYTEAFTTVTTVVKVGRWHSV